jgi:curved DNA-binding protein CbpA
MMASEQKPTSGLADSGDLALLPFPRLFYRLCREQRTGRLDVRDKPKEAGGKIFKRLVMAQGARFLVQGGTVEETLPEVLRLHQRLKPEDLEKLKTECGGDFGKMEQKVLSGVVVPASELAELMALQAGIKIKQLFSFIRGVYEWKPIVESALPERSQLVPLSPEKLLLEGVKQYYHEARVNKEFPGINKKSMTLSPELKDRINAFGLPPAAQKWLRSLPESLNLQSGVRTKALPEAEAYSLLLALYFGGLLTLPSGEDDFPVGRAYQDKEPAKLAAKPAEKPAAPQAAPIKKEEPKLPIEELLDREMTDKELLQELDGFLATARDSEKNYFDLLGLPETAPSSKIKQVYFKFARRFHPDARPDLFVGEVRDRVEDLFTKISEAYNILGDGESRTTYTKNIKSKVSKEDMEKASRAIEAEMEFQKAEAMLKKGAWRPALELLDRSVQLQPDEPEYKLYQVWARYKINGISDADNARRQIEKIAEARPQSADAWFYLGQLAREDGNLDQAEKHFEKAAALKPHDVDIRRELQLLYRRKDKAETKKGGGLFGKKK